MSQTLTKEIIYTAFSHLKELVELVDADLKDRFGLAVILRRNNNTVAQLNGVETTVSFTLYKLSMIRWINDNHFLVATYENEEDKENIFIVDLFGRLLH